MTKKLGSIKRIFGVLAIGGALLFGIGAAAAPSTQAAQRAVIVVRQNNRQNNRWEREHRRDWERRERERQRQRMMHHRWQDRWGNWHWS